MRKSIWSILTVIILFISCHSGAGGTWKDDHIDPKIRAEIHELNNQVIEGFIEGNQEKVFSNFSDKLIEQAKNDAGVKSFVNTLMQEAKKRISKDKFVVLNEFLQKNTTSDMQTNVFTGISGNHDYIIGFNSLTKESFISVGYFKDDLSQTCMVFIYGKYGDKWKLNIMQVGLLKIMNKDAYDWYDVAKSDYKKGYLIDAVNDLTIANQILIPANQVWHYQKEKEIADFGQKVMAEISTKYHLPMTVDYVKTKPQIFRIFPQGMAEGYFPTVFYTTTLDLNDSIKLSKECDEIHSRIGEIYNGIDKNKKMIFYRAFKSIPNGTTPVENFGFIRRYRE